MRWADLDSLDHVNNVVYLAYAAEALAAMADDGLLGSELRPVTVTVRFARPLRLGRRPVVVESSVDGDTIAQRICVDGDGDRAVFAEVTTLSGDRTPAAVQEEVATLPISLRRDDLDARGVATTAKVFELVQEARVLHIASLLGAMPPGRLVVGTSAVTFHDDVTWSREPLQTSAWISRVGRGSFDLRSQLTDGGAVLADSISTLVGFDAGAQASHPFDDDERALLDGMVSAHTSAPASSGRDRGRGGVRPS